MLSSSIGQVHSLLKGKSLSSTELCKASLKRAKSIEELNAFVCLVPDISYEQSRSSDIRHEKKKTKGVFDGITFAVKDNFCTKGIKTTCGSLMLKNFVPTYTATVVQRLLNSGGVLIGKCNLDEFAMGSGTVDSIHGPTRNIWGSNPGRFSEEGNPGINEWRIAGGSSGGSAVAVAAGACFAALGSDSGGSTRNPASYCGVVGFKPTYSSVSRHGLIPLVNSMDVPGILTRCIEDAAIIYNIISGYDEKDSTSCACLGKLVLDSNSVPKKLRVGIPAEYYCDGISENVLETCEEIIDLLQRSGVSVQSVSMPHTELSIACYSVLNQCEVASNMARYDGLRYGHRAEECGSTDKLYAKTRSEGFNRVVRERILAGNYFLLQKNYQKYFEKALRIRRLIFEDFKKVWDEVDILLTPTTLTEAPLLEDYTKLHNREQCSFHDFCTQPVNMAGCPAVSIPIKLSKNNLPLSIQLIGKNFEDGKLLSMAKWIQDRVSFPKLKLLLEPNV